MPKKRIKVIIDTNIWISYLLTNSFRKIDQLIESDSILLIFSEELISEFLSVIHRPKFKIIIDDSDIDLIFQTLLRKSELVHVKTDLNLCRDSKDNFLLNLTIDSHTDYLVTGDSDLLIMKKIGFTKIIEIKKFLDLF
jgi:putative PIN family toxin of toxin-antitoxin system